MDHGGKIMSRKRFKAEEIVNKLREADVLIAQGRTVVHACKQIGVTEQTYYRWRKEYGGLKADQAKRLKELERENARLKRRKTRHRTPTGLLLPENLTPCVDRSTRRAHGPNDARPTQEIADAVGVTDTKMPEGRSLRLLKCGRLLKHRLFDVAGIQSLLQIQRARPIAGRARLVQEFTK